jgi:transcription elongation factor Elf1
MVNTTHLNIAAGLSSKLERYSVKSTAPYRINFRCPICGDSKKSRTKARGWLLETTDTGALVYYCHNCGESGISLAAFLKQVDMAAYNELIAAEFLEKATAYRVDAKAVSKPASYDLPKPKRSYDPLKDVKKLSQLPINHPARVYVKERLIPSHQHYRIYYAPKFKAWINKHIPNKFEDVTLDHPRLLFPFVDKSGQCFGVSARSFDPNGLRYMTIMFEARPKVFGLDRVDFNRRYTVTEGAVDSLFLDNAVAKSGADMNVNGLQNLPNATFVFDNEPRNKEVCNLMQKAINHGYKVCIWPDTKGAKDINQMVQNGITNIDQLIADHTYKGLEANLEFMKWKKI